MLVWILNEAILPNETFHMLFDVKIIIFVQVYTINSKTCNDKKILLLFLQFKIKKKKKLSPMKDLGEEDL